MHKFILSIIIMIIILSGCSLKPAADPHPDWDAEWFRMGNHLAVEPVSDFELNESNDLLSISGLYYATWTSGEGQKITNQEGNEAIVYDAQIYLLLKEEKTAESAEKDIADWMKRESNSYETAEQQPLPVNDQEYTLLPLVSVKSENPYDHGIAAFAVNDKNAISIELLCNEAYGGDPESILTDFLDGIHY